MHQITAAQSVRCLRQVCPLLCLQVRARALKVILQILVACPAALLLEALRDLPLAAFLCSLLATRDAATLAAALHCCEVLMAKLPDVFRHAFLKEGVAHAIEQIASSVSATQAAVGSPPPPPALISPPNPARGGLAASTDEPRRGEWGPIIVH